MEASRDTSQDEFARAAPSELLTEEEVSRGERQRPQPFRRFRSIADRSGVDAGYVERIEAELVLLREENARLRFEAAQPPDAGAMIERLKSVSASSPDQDHRDEAWHLISEALVMREVLIDVCKEIGQTMITLQTRLTDLALDLPDRSHGAKPHVESLPPPAHGGPAFPASPPAPVQ